MNKLDLKITCQYCGESKIADEFLKAKSPFFPTGRTNICIDCLEDWIEQKNGKFEIVDAICRWLDIPFKPDIWSKYYKINGSKGFQRYAEQMYSECYPMLNWKNVNEQYLELEKQHKLDETMPELKAEKRQALRKKWGEEYSDTDIEYLEDLFQGILQTQNVNGKIQTDDALKLCKISLLLNHQIRDGEEFDKTLKSYDLLRKSGDFTPKNVKNACDFDSVGEVFAYCEKKGFENAFYDDTPRDVVDLLMKNIQTWLRALYTNESSIPADVAQRVEALKIADEMEDNLLAVQDDGLDEYESEGYDVDEEFSEEAGL